MDVDTIALGRDFRQVLRERVESCDLMLALVGRNWVDAKNSSGQRRLEDRDDFVRQEIEAALKRNIPVTPVLVQGAQMPSAGQLPEEIRNFAYRNGFELIHNRWNSDVQEMTKRLGLSKQRHDRKPWPTIVGVSVVAIALVGGGFFYYRTVSNEKTAVQTQSELRAVRQAMLAKVDRLSQAEAIALVTRPPAPINDDMRLQAETIDPLNQRQHNEKVAKAVLKAWLSYSVKVGDYSKWAAAMGVVQ
jgi:hypothetical protein